MAAAFAPGGGFRAITPPQVDGRFTSEGGIGRNLVFDVQARKAFGFTKGDTFSQTRWRF